jgi:hypothetical protein
MSIYACGPTLFSYNLSYPYMVRHLWSCLSFRLQEPVVGVSQNNVLSQGDASYCWEVSNVCSVSGKVIFISISRHRVAASPSHFPTEVTKFETQWLYPIGLCQIFRLPIWWEGDQLRQTATPEQWSFCRGSELCAGWNRLSAGHVERDERGTRGNK